MVFIDGSLGEGGGQIVRSSLSLSLVTGQSVVIENVRARREKPGLLRQHLTALEAATAISGAKVQGNQLQSSHLSFEPGPIRCGTYRFDIGSAGSTTLVLQTILPALMIGNAPSSIELEGGTHNRAAPPFEFLKTTFLPLLARMGPAVNLELQRYGFYPAGGGSIRAVIQPSSTIGPLRLVAGGVAGNERVRALVARLPETIAWRECRTIIRELNWEERVCSVETIRESLGPGNVVMAEVERGGVNEVFTGFGQRGVPAEIVAEGVVNQVRRYRAADVPVGEHLADQLLLPLALGAHFGGGGGEFRTLELSPHAHTHIEVLQSFLNVRVQVDVLGRDDVHVHVIPSESY